MKPGRRDGKGVDIDVEHWRARRMGDLGTGIVERCMRGSKMNGEREGRAL